jgi:hypothetical protein
MPSINWRRKLEIVKLNVNNKKALDDKPLKEIL